MTLKDRPYTDPAYHVPQLASFPAEAGGASAGIYSRIAPVAAGKIRNVSLVVTVAGTTTGNGFDIMLGTTSIGNVTLGTQAAGAVGTSGDLNTAVAVGQVLALRASADTVGKALGSFEWQFTPGALFNE